MEQNLRRDAERIDKAELDRSEASVEILPIAIDCRVESETMLSHYSYKNYR